jgi:hypothetical protein
MRRNSLSVSRRHSGEALQPASQRPDHALPAHRRCAAPDSAALSDGNDLRRDPLAVRKATLASLLARAAPGLRFNEHLDEKDASLPCLQARARRHRVEATQTRHIARGRSPDWIKSKNPAAPAVERTPKRELGR